MKKNYPGPPKIKRCQLDRTYLFSNSGFCIASLLARSSVNLSPLLGTLTRATEFKIVSFYDGSLVLQMSIDGGLLFLSVIIIFSSWSIGFSILFFTLAEASIKPVTADTEVPPLGIVQDYICDFLFLESRQIAWLVDEHGSITDTTSSSFIFKLIRGRFIFTTATIEKKIVIRACFRHELLPKIEDYSKWTIKEYLLVDSGQGRTMVKPHL